MTKIGTEKKRRTHFFDVTTICRNFRKTLENFSRRFPQIYRKISSFGEILGKYRKHISVTGKNIILRNTTHQCGNIKEIMLRTMKKT